MAALRDEESQMQQFPLNNMSTATTSNTMSTAATATTSLARAPGQRGPPTENDALLKDSQTKPVSHANSDKNVSVSSSDNDTLTESLHVVINEGHRFQENQPVPEIDPPPTKKQIVESNEAAPLHPTNPFNDASGLITSTPKKLDNSPQTTTVVTQAEVHQPPPKKNCSSHIYWKPLNMIHRADNYS